MRDKRQFWEALYVHVYAMVRRWKQTPTVAAAAAAAAKVAATAAEAGIRDRAMRDAARLRAATERRAAAAAAGATADTAAEDDNDGEDDGDDDVVIVAEKTLDQVEKLKQELARMTGDYLDLTVIESQVGPDTIRVLAEKREEAQVTERGRLERARTEDRARAALERQTLAAIVNNPAPTAPANTDATASGAGARRSAGAGVGPSSAAAAAAASVSLPGAALVGRAVRKILEPRGVFMGNVRAWDATTELYHVEYEEGYSEDLELHEVRELLVATSVDKGKGPEAGEAKEEEGGAASAGGGGGGSGGGGYGSGDGACVECGVEDDDGLLCDGCDAVHHVACAGMVPDDVPEGDWFCQMCVDMGVTKARAARVAAKAAAAATAAAATSSTPSPPGGVVT